MRLINALGPWPINTGRNIGNADAGFDGVALACAVGVALPCDQARSIIDNKANKQIANTRMARYASGVRRFFKRDFAKVYVPQRLLIAAFPRLECAMCKSTRGNRTYTRPDGHCGNQESIERS